MLSASACLCLLFHFNGADCVVFLCWRFADERRCNRRNVSSIGFWSAITLTAAWALGRHRRAWATLGDAPDTRRPERAVSGETV